MLLLFLLLLPIKSYTAASCESDGLHYQCLGDNQKCIPLDWLCDGKADCMNGDDEHGQVCEPRGSQSKIFERGSCPPLQFECEDMSGERKCILERWRCDRHNDCKNGMDEEGCDYTNAKPESPPQLLNIFNLARPVNCSEGQFLCTFIKECLPNRSLVCDGRKDCRDGTDEINCGKATSQKPSNLNNSRQSTSDHSKSNRTSNEKSTSGQTSQQLPDRLSSTPILPLLSQKSTSSFLYNLSTLFSQAQTKVTSERKIEPTQTSLSSKSRIEAKATESFRPISPNFVDPVSHSANKPERVSIHRIQAKATSTPMRTNPSTTQATNSLTTVGPTKSPEKREKIAIFPQFKSFGKYIPIIPQL